MKRTYRKSLILSLTAALAFGTGAGVNELMHPHPVAAQTSMTKAPSTKALSQLNEDFIQISKQVTPAVVSIAMTKTVHNQSQGLQQLDPRSREFFNHFGLPFPQAPNQDRRMQGLGSGVIVDAQKGYVLTNNHVVDGADEIKVTLTDRRTFKARIVGTDKRTDLAVIALENADHLHQIKLGDSAGLHVGEWVLAIGNPFGLDSTVTSGIISAKGRDNVGVADYEDFIQTDAAINPGNSGGALVNIKGELIGINTAIATRTQGYMGIGFAIPSNMAHQVMDSLIKNGKVARSQLGVYIQQIDNSMAQGLSLKDANQGILVSGVMKGSPGEEAGLKKYDVILKLNGQPVNDTNQFRNKVALTAPGTKIDLEVMRNGKTMSLHPTLREASDSDGKQAQVNQPGMAASSDLSVDELTPNLRNQFQIPAGVDGVVVTRVAPDSQAYEKGVRPGDVIIEINRQPVRSQQDFDRLYGQVDSGQPVLLALNRQGGYLIVAYRKR